MLARWPVHPRVDLITTDGFLLPNAELKKRGIMDRKGFPESFDTARLLNFLHEVKSGRENVQAPVYSHFQYDIVPNQFMTGCVRHILQEPGIPVWFGATCHPTRDRENGAWATDLFEYGRVYGVDFDLDKEQRVRFGDSAMNHAMAFVGVDVDEDGHTTRRWRVENSWGDKIADKGYFTMSDDWFTEYVYEVAVPKALLPEEYQKALEEPATMLPAWDPMGALA